MRFKNTFSAFLFFFFTLPALAGVTGNPDVFNTGIWVQHPGIAVGKLFASDSRMITLAGDGNGYLHAWYPNGTEIPGFPKLLNAGVPAGGIKQAANDYVNSTPTLIDINGDGNLEIFVGSGDGYVYGLNNHGNNLPGWPKFTGVSTGDGVYGVFGSPAVADIDGDGNFEVIVGAWSHYIYVWNAEDGSTYPGWPFNNADTVWSSPAVADFDQDGRLEIVIGCDSTVPEGGLLRVFRYNGTQMPGWPQGIDQVIWSSPAIGDIDNDGQLEIVVGTGHFYGSGRGEYVNAYEWSGSKVAGWPVSLADGNGATDNRVFGSPALVDVDSNGTLEVFVGALDGYLYCLNSNGTIRWKNTPVWAGGNPGDFALLSSPAVGDIDGDGRFEVVVGGGWHITAFDAQTGTKEAGYPIETGYPDLGGQPMFTWSSPTIADVNSDGLVDLVIGNGRKDLSGWPNAGSVRVYHESGSAGTTNLGPTGVSRNVAPWPRFRLSNSGTGSTHDTVASTGGGSQALISGASVAPFVFSPNGDNINDTSTISFHLSAGDQITVEVLDRNGAAVATLVSGASLSAGSHTAAWNGLTNASVLANDGMYTFRIRGQNASAVQGTLGVNNTVPEVSKSWFLAEGSTVGFAAYVLVQNPNDSPVTVTLTFFKQDGTTKVYTETVPAQTRTTVPIHREVPETYSVSTAVEANLPIIVERAMYFNNDRGGHNSIGVTRTSQQWYFPANRTIAGDEDFILIVNPASSAATLTATYIFENQAPVVQTHTISATSRFTIPVHGYFPNNRVSVHLSSTLPVAAERAFYFSFRTGGASGIGAVSPSLSWYFAEGDTGSGATTYLDLFNPSSSAASVTVNFMLENGTLLPRSFNIAAQRRLTIDASQQIGANQRFHAEILSTAPIVAERMMFAGGDVGDSIGSPTTANVWNLAEGFTAFGYQTWVLISNPGNEAANVTVRFMQQNGVNVVRNYTLGARQRLTLYVNDFVEPLSVSTQVTSDKPIVVERTMKFQNGQGMHQGLGVRQ